MTERKLDHLDRLIAYISDPEVYYAPDLDELKAARDEIKRFRDAKAILRDALREAYDAGRQQGQDSATAYEWGSSSTYTDEQAFKEALEPYEGAIAKVLALIEEEAA